MPSQKMDKQNNPVISWVRVKESIPNDYRDCLRYAETAAIYRLRAGSVPPRVVETEAQRAERERKREQPAPRFTNPHGQPFYVGDR
jgi:hypothetical protein